MLSVNEQRGSSIIMTLQLVGTLITREDYYWGGGGGGGGGGGRSTLALRNLGVVSSGSQRVPLLLLLPRVFLSCLLPRCFLLVVGLLLRNSCAAVSCRSGCLLLRVTAASWPEVVPLLWCCRWTTTSRGRPALALTTTTPLSRALACSRAHHDGGGGGRWWLCGVVALLLLPLLLLLLLLLRRWRRRRSRRRGLSGCWGCRLLLCCVYVGGGPCTL